MWYRLLAIFGTVMTFTQGNLWGICSEVSVPSCLILMNSTKKYVQSYLIE